MSNLIRRDKAIDYFVTNIGIVDADGYAVDDYDERVKIWTERFSGIPSAEPERKKGHWTGDCCSCCGVSKYNYIKMVDDECGPFGTWNFCPHCGADMRGKDGKA